jgi:peptide/nickel transport system substrate-binding protein
MRSRNDFRFTTPLGRRSFVAAAVTGGIGLAASSAFALRQSPGPAGSAGTPAASPIASPVASPQASPIATPTPAVTSLPGSTPVTSFPLEVIRDQRPVESTEPVSGGDLRLFVQSADLGNFSPVSFRQDFQVACSLYDPLVWLDEVTCEPKPCLAESWKWSSDGLTLTFTIRDGVSWHDGSALTADDVAFSFVVYQQDIDSAVSGFFSLVSDIHSADDRTVVVTFDRIDGSFLFNAGNLFIFQANQYGFAWSSRAQGERTLNGYDWSKNPPIGTGPWRIDAASSSQVTLTRNAKYWAGPPHAERLILTAEDDLAKRIDAWKEDKVDIIWPVTPLETSKLIEEPGRLYAAESLRTLFAAYNFNNPTRIAPDLFSSVDFRQALLLAMDRDKYQQSIFGSFIDTSKAGSITQPWARDERIVNPARNLDIANSRLDAMGWVDNDGDGIRETPAGDILSLVAIVQAGDQPELIQILLQLDADFRQIGVSLTVEELEPDAWTARWTTTHDFDLIGYSLLTYGAFDEFDLYGSAWDIRANQAGWNPGGYANEAVDAAIAEWFGTTDIEAMKVALYKLQRAVTDDPFGLFFGFPQDPVLVRSGILGYQPNKIWQSWNTRMLWKSTRSS